MSKIKLFSIIFITILFGLFSVKSANAETVSLSGRISDNTSTAISGATIDVINSGNNATVASTISDGSGNYAFILSGGTYNVKVTPPAGSNFSPAIALNQNISNNRILNFILTSAGIITLSGHVYGGHGNPVPNQTVYLKATGATVATATTITDSGGNYSLQVSAGSYTLGITSDNNDFSLHVPQRLWIEKANYSLTQSTILDITIPARKIDFHIQDAQGNPVSNVGLQTSSNGLTNRDQLSIGGGITDARALTSVYGVFNPPPKTDSNGNLTLWLIPNSIISGIDSSYNITAIPPSGSV